MKSPLPLMIRKTAGRLQRGTRVKLRHMKQLWTCVEAASPSNGQCAKITRGGRSQWLSENYPVMIPIDQDPFLGKGVLP